MYTRKNYSTFFRALQTENHNQKIEKEIVPPKIFSQISSAPNNMRDLDGDQIKSPAVLNGTLFTPGTLY